MSNDVMTALPAVDTLDRLSGFDFARRYVEEGRPVLIKGALKACRAFETWGLDRLRLRAGEKIVSLKEFGPSGISIAKTRLGDYVDTLERYENRAPDATFAQPAYLHDIPLTSVFETARADLAAFPQDYFPDWYGADWTNFAQLFLGPSKSLTPLHFDCLLTHNLFFQVIGRKRFTVLDQAQLGYCYTYDWRWCAVDPESPDYARHPLYRNASPSQVLVEPGDVFYMPPGMLHHVRSIDCALSFNVDWHTKESALKGVLAGARGMPLQNVYYNLILAFGLWSGVSNRRLMPYYRSYLRYVS